MNETKLKEYFAILSEYETTKMFTVEGEARSMKLLAILLPFIEDEFKKEIEKLQKGKE